MTEKILATILALLAVTAAISLEQPRGANVANTNALRNGTFSTGATPPAECPPLEHIVDVPTANPHVDKTAHDSARAKLVAALGVQNSWIRLGPDVEIDFSDVPDDQLPLQVARCVALSSVTQFTSEAEALKFHATAAGDSFSLADTSARTAHSAGPLLRLGKHPENPVKALLHIWCPADNPPNDHVRVAGLRMEGPTRGQQTITQFGILVQRCLDVDISNVEIAGFGGAAIRVVDDGEAAEGPGQDFSNNRPGDRIGRPEQVRISRSYFHHNQHESEAEDVPDYDLYHKLMDQHAAGYGVDIHHGAWATITENVFDDNRHAVASAGDMRGYDARRNLILRGGGIHGRAFNEYTHIFDIHGTGCIAFSCGRAGTQAWMFDNAFQYRHEPDIKIRGMPDVALYVGHNVFPMSVSDAITLQTPTHVHVEDTNIGNFDSYGQYGVCDFDGDGYDDLFLATGVTWWFSGMGEFPWTYLNLRNERLSQVRLGYFDGDNKCDVLTQSGPNWVISSGGTGPWTPIGAFSAPLSEVVFGRFNPTVRDHRPGVTRRTTDAFRRAPSGEWFITSLSAPNWQRVQHSSYPLSQLKFGDFTGDGVTDVLAVDHGHWAISESARSDWQPLNAHNADAVAGLFIADLNNDNIDDVLKLVTGASNARWFVSDNGTGPWRELKKHTFSLTGLIGGERMVGLTGRFGIAPGAATLVIDPQRIGHFYGPTESRRGANPDWANSFAF